MTVQQISIFVENKAGTLLKVLELLKEANIQIVASTIADTVEYGIYRIICSEPARAYTTLQGAGISVALSDVFALTLDNVPGRAADAAADPVASTEARGFYTSAPTSTPVVEAAPAAPTTESAPAPVVAPAPEAPKVTVPVTETADDIADEYEEIFTFITKKSKN